MEICIYCCGAYGLNTYLRLRDNGIAINYFSDIDKQKCGYCFDGIYCIPYEELMLNDRVQTVIIVCKKYPQDIIKMLKKEGFRYVYSYETVEKKFDVKYGDIDFDNEEMIKHINVFREELYQICLNNGMKSTWEKSDFPFYQEMRQILLDTELRKRQG